MKNWEIQHGKQCLSLSYYWPNELRSCQYSTILWAKSISKKTRSPNRMKPPHNPNVDAASDLRQRQIPLQQQVVVQFVQPPHFGPRQIHSLLLEQLARTWLVSTRLEVMIPAWIVKNSWGTRWGVEGYFLLHKDAHNQCGLADNGVFFILWFE